MPAERHDSRKKRKVHELLPSQGERDVVEVLRHLGWDTDFNTNTLKVPPSPRISDQHTKIQCFLLRWQRVVLFRATSCILFH